MYPRRAGSERRATWLTGYIQLGFLLAVKRRLWHWHARPRQLTSIREECVRNRPYGSRVLQRVAVVTGLVAAVLLGAAGRAAPSNGEAAVGVPSSPPADSATVVATVERFHAAVAAGDSSGALALLAPDAVVLESGGVETRDEFRAHHLAADIEFARAVKSERGPMRVVVRGDAAWAWSTSTTSGEFRGRPVNSAGAELVVLTRLGQEWKITAVHWSSRSRRAPGNG